MRSIVVMKRMEEVMYEDLIRQLEQWHKEERYREIVDRILSCKDYNSDYVLVSHLARAYNNVDEFEKALKWLVSVEENGKQDPLWYFRMGYAYYYLNRDQEAMEMFEQVCRKNAEDMDAWMYLAWCYDSLGMEPRLILPSEVREHKDDWKYKDEQQSYSPELYSEEVLDHLEGHIEKYFGAYDEVIHEIISPDIHVDICLIKPSKERDCYTLVTMGMGAHRMHVPDMLTEESLDRAELLICLPKDWKLNDSDEKWYWPQRWLKILARLPGEEDTWLGYGHTVPNGGPFAENTKLSGVILNLPEAFGEDAHICEMPDHEAVRFYQVIPLYEEELVYKRQNCADALFKRLEESQVSVADLNRPNVCLDESSTCL